MSTSSNKYPDIHVYANFLVSEVISLLASCNIGNKRKKKNPNIVWMLFEKFPFLADLTLCSCTFESDYKAEIPLRSSCEVKEGCKSRCLGTLKG